MKEKTKEITMHIRCDFTRKEEKLVRSAAEKVNRCLKNYCEVVVLERAMKDLGK